MEGKGVAPLGTRHRRRPQLFENHFRHAASLNCMHALVEHVSGMQHVTCLRAGLPRHGHNAGFPMRSLCVMCSPLCCVRHWGTFQRMKVGRAPHVTYQQRNGACHHQCACTLVTITERATPHHTENVNAEGNTHAYAFVALVLDDDDDDVTVICD